VRYEEDPVDLSDSAQRSGNQDWFWMVVAGRVYLVDSSRKVWYSSDVTSLLGVYLSAIGSAHVC
jgi:hypothetical protein